MSTKENGLLSISQFADLSGITRPNLIFYDKEDLLKPALRTGNNYRLYDYKQIGLAYQIQVYRKMGLSLDQIRTILKNSSCEETIDVLEQQSHELDKQIIELQQQKYNMQFCSDYLKRYGNQQEAEKFEIEVMTEETLTLSPQLETLGEDFSTMNQFLMYCRKKGISLDCHIGRMFSKDRLDRTNWQTPEYVYFKRLNGTHKKAAGKYLVYTARSDGSDIDSVYRKIFKYLDEHDLEITGNLYEDYPLSGIVASDRDLHLIRIMAPVL